MPRNFIRARFARPIRSKGSYSTDHESAGLRESRESRTTEQAPMSTLHCRRLLRAVTSHRGGCGSLTVDPSLHDNPSHGARVGTELPKSQLFSSCADGHAAQPDKGLGQEKGPFFKMVRAGGGMPETNARHWKRKCVKKGQECGGRMVDTLGPSPGTVLLIRTEIAPGTHQSHRVFVVGDACGGLTPASMNSSCAGWKRLGRGSLPGFRYSSSCSETGRGMLVECRQSEIRWSPCTELHGIGSDQMHKNHETPLVIPCKFSAVTNSTRRPCAHLSASCARPDNKGIKGLRTRPKCGQEWRGVPKSTEAGC